MMLHFDRNNSTGLPPYLSAKTQYLLADQSGLLNAWVEQYGSPLHLVRPQEVAANVAALVAVFDEFGVDRAIYYGAKVNKSPALIAAALQAGVGIDVSSAYELRDAIRFGAGVQDIVATGPAKSGAFHDDLVRLGALVSIDSPEELDDLLKRIPANSNRQPILLRLRPSGHERSRFGMPATTVRSCLNRISEQQRLRFDGLHFHLGGYRWEDRATALREAAELTDEARKMGLSPCMIDIGGGLPVQYVSEPAWKAHIDNQKAEDYRTGRTPSSLYPYGGPLNAAEWLRLFLNAPMTPAQNIGGYLREHRLTLAMEPGRSLVDQAAISVFRITRVKDLSRGNRVIFVEGSSFSACETWFGSEFLIDPILVPVGNRTGPAEPWRGYIAGHSCLDEDVLSNRWLSFATNLQAGDLLIWANTAGYQMDLLENEFHRYPMPKRLYLTENTSGELSVNIDK